MNPVHGVILLTPTKTELLDEFSSTNKDPTVASRSAPVSDDTVGIRDAAFTWAASHTVDAVTTPSRRSFRLLVEGELTFKSGAINLITGPTGSGKTSLLMALLRKCAMRFDCGLVERLS